MNYGVQVKEKRQAIAASLGRQAPGKITGPNDVECEWCSKLEVNDGVMVY